MGLGRLLMPRVAPGRMLSAQTAKPKLGLVRVSQPTLVSSSRQISPAIGQLGIAS